MCKNFKFSLVMPTLGRTDEVELFIISLINQRYKDYELIIVDQNKDNSVKNIYEKYKSRINAKYIHSDIKGLSKCRNIGLKVASGDIIAFPDDDCEYSERLLFNISNIFYEDDTIDILTFKSIDKETLKDSNTKWLSHRQVITSLNIEATAISYTIFIKRKNVKSIIFDEQMGVGEFFGSAEETDMLSTLINDGYKAIYIPDLYAYHPIKAEVEERYYKYALGMGAYIKKEIKLRSKSKYFIRAIELIIIRPIGGIVVNIFRFDRDKIKKYYLVLCGRIKGFLKYKMQK